MKKIQFSSATTSPQGVIDVSPEETLAKKSQVTLVDVRRPDEWVGELGHIEGSHFATLESDLIKFLDTADREETYVFVCRSGGRSGTAAALAGQKGFQTVYNMSGGMLAWNRSQLPVTKTR
jgi:rhodanese-related sulfurtransferase